MEETLILHGSHDGATCGLVYVAHSYCGSDVTPPGGEERTSSSFRLMMSSCVSGSFSSVFG